MRRPVFDRLTMFVYTIGVVLVAGNLLRLVLGLPVAGGLIPAGLLIMLVAFALRRRWP